MGDFCNPFDPSYDPTLCGTAPPFQGGPIGGASGPVNVQISLTVPPLPIQVVVPASIGTNIANGLTGVIHSALEGVAKEVGGVLEGLAAVILSGVTSAVKDIGKFIVSGFDSIVTALGNLAGAIGKALSNIFGPIFSGLQSAIKGVGDVLKDLVKNFTDKIGALIQAVKDNGALALLPVLQAVVTSINLVRGVIAAIQLDIHAGARALVLLPSQIADSLTSLDATLDRALQQIGFRQGARVNTTIGTLDGAPFDHLVQSFIDTLNPPDAGIDPLGIFQGYQTLTASCKSQGVDDFIRVARWMETLPSWIKGILEGVFLYIPGFLASLAGTLEKQMDLAREAANQLCPLQKLDPSSAVEAALRSIIDDGTLRRELLVQGYDDKHVSVLQKLALQRLDIDKLMDAAYRGIIDTGARDTGLRALGYTDLQIPILEAQSKALPTLNDALRWWNFGVIDEGTFDKLTAILRLTPEQTDLLKRTYFTKETVQQQIVLDGRLKAIKGGYIPLSANLVFDPLITDAARREQLGDGNVQLQWQAHWQLPSYLAIIQGYFRQLRTLDSVQKAMQAENIPEEFWDELIQIQRPLLPFRSIPGYLTAGVISDADAIVELTGHGFDPQHIQWILEYARRAKKPAASASVASVGQLSIATARSLFDDGAITQDQYVAVLEQHKFPHDIAVLQANADSLAAHAKQRKQAITDLIDETLAGIVTVDDTISSLQRQGFTPAEIARYEKGVRRAKASSAKHPSVSEMKAFLKAHLITGEQFKNELELQGWTDPWLTAWQQLDVAPGQ